MPIPTKFPFVLLLLMCHPVLLLLSHLDCLKEYSIFTGSTALPPKALKSGFLLEFSSEPAFPGSPGPLGE